MFEKLKKHKPLIKNVNEVGGRPDTRFHPIKFDIPTKSVANTKGNMELLNMYVRGELKWEDTGRTCGNCVFFYPDKLGSRLGGRCKAYGFKEVHEDTPADDTRNWVHPATKENFPLWPGCPTFTKKDRLSRR